MKLLPNECFAYACRHQVDHRHGHHDDDHHRAGFGVLKAPNDFPEDHTHAAGAHHAHHGSRADVGFKAVQRVGNPQRQHLRDDAVDDFFERIGTGRAYAFHRLRVYGFHGFREQLGQHARGVHEQRQHAGKRAQAHGHDEQHREHHLVDGARRVHHAPDRLPHPGRRDVGRRQQAQRHGEHHGQRRAPHGDLQRHQHFLQVKAPLAEVGREKIRRVPGHVAGVAHQVQRAHVRALPRSGQHGHHAAPGQHAQQAGFRDVELQRRHRQRG
jgi:hypothetical protein